MTEFVLISCSKSKRDGVHLGRDLYEPSAIFRKRRKFSRRRGDAWGILSAKHGYIADGEAIEDYERHISDRTPVWGAFVLRDLLEDLRFYDVDQVTVLAGSRYVEPLVAELEARGYDVVDWNAGKRPGERMSALDKANEPTEQQPLVTDGGRDTAGLHRSLDVDRRDRWAWLGAVALFGLGDVATTAVGLNIGAVESNPVALALFDALGLWPAMLLLKATVLGLVGLLWACSPQEFRADAPLTLAVWGALAVLNNSYVIGVLLA